MHGDDSHLRSQEVFSKALRLKPPPPPPPLFPLRGFFTRICRSLWSVFQQSFVKYSWHLRFQRLTIRYCSLSITARLAYRSNMDVLSPSDFATLFFTIGWSCLWSPIRTTCLADSELTIGMRVSGSRHIPHSSTMHWMTFPQTCSILLLPAAEQVQRTMRPNFLIAHCSASFISYNWSNQEVYLSSTLNLFLPCMFHKFRKFISLFVESDVSFCTDYSTWFN